MAVKPEPPSIYALVARNHGFSLASTEDEELVGSIIAEINRGVSLGQPDDKLEAVAALGAMGVASQIMHDERVFKSEKGGEFLAVAAKDRIAAAKEYRESARHLGEAYRRAKAPERAKRVEVVESDDIKIARREGLL